MTYASTTHSTGTTAIGILGGMYRQHSASIMVAGMADGTSATMVAGTADGITHIMTHSLTIMDQAG